MADFELSSDTPISAASLDGTEKFPVRKDGAPDSVLASALKTFILSSSALTGVPTAPTPTLGDNTTKVASTAFVQAAVAAVINSAPGALDTLNELAAAMGNDANFAASTATALALKAPLASPALTGSPTAPTPTTGDNTTKIATTAFVTTAVAAGGGGGGGGAGDGIAKNAPRSDKTANYTAATTDLGKTIRMDATSGALSLTLPASMTADGDFIIIRKSDSSSNAVSVFLNDGTTLMAFMKTQRDEVVMWYANSSWFAKEWHIAPQGYIYDTPGSFTFTKLPLMTILEGELIGSGGSGAAGPSGDNSVNRAGGGGGGAGGVVQFSLPASAVGATETIVVPAGATGGVGTAGGAGAQGSVGLPAKFGAVFWARGGMRGIAGGTTAAGSAGSGTSSALNVITSGTSTTSVTPGSGGGSSLTSSGSPGSKGSLPNVGGGPGGGGGAGCLNTADTLGTASAGGAGHNGDGLGLFQQDTASTGGGGAAGAAGSAGQPGTNAVAPFFGSGGGSGHGSTTAAGGAGGAGGYPGAGGGGGGPARTSFAGGGGGASGRGEVRLLVKF